MSSVNFFTQRSDAFWRRTTGFPLKLVTRFVVNKEHCFFLFIYYLNFITNIFTSLMHNLFNVTIVLLQNKFIN